MVDKAQFVNVNINVNGKVHKVKIQEGVGIDNDRGNWHGGQDSAWHVKNGSLFAWEETKETHTSDDGIVWTDGNYVYTPKKTNEIKMSEAEFALLKNVADNVNEGGDVITLSRADIEKAQELFSQGKFTADITKNLPAGYHGSKGAQYMQNGKSLTASVNNYDKNQDALATAKGKEYEYEIANLIFYNKVEEDKYLEIYAKKSSDGKVRRVYDGEGEGGAEWTLYTYKDKEGNLITESPDYNSAMAEYGYNTGEGAKLMRFEGTDAEGKYVIASYDGPGVNNPVEEDALRNLGLDWSYSQIKTSKTSDGSDFIELYGVNDDNFVLENIVIRYNDGNKAVHELKDKDGHPSKKIVDYTENGKTIHEDYDKDNKLVKKTVKYKKGNNSITEEYDSAKVLVKKVIDGNGHNRENRVTEYYENGKFVKKEIDDKTERYIKGDTVKVAGRTVIQCANFNAKEWANKELSEKAKTYREAYKNEKPKNIAKAIKDQIEGVSGNSKTVAMVKAIPSVQFVKVLKEYKNLDSWLWFESASLFTDLMDEYFMDGNDLADIAKQAFAAYIQDKNADKVTEADVKMAKFVQQGPKDNLKEYMLKIEDYITK